MVLDTVVLALQGCENTVTKSAESPCSSLHKLCQSRWHHLRHFAHGSLAQPQLNWSLVNPLGFTSHACLNCDLTSGCLHILALNLMTTRVSTATLFPTPALTPKVYPSRRKLLASLVAYWLKRNSSITSSKRTLAKTAIYLYSWVTQLPARPLKLLQFSLCCWNSTQWTPNNWDLLFVLYIYPLSKVF